MMMRLSWGVGVRRNRLWMVRVVTSTRESSSGMNRRSRAMAWPGEGKGQAKAVCSGKAWQLRGLTLIDVCAALRRLSKDLAGLRRKKVQNARGISLCGHVKGSGHARDLLRCPGALSLQDLQEGNLRLKCSGGTSFSGQRTLCGDI